MQKLLAIFFMFINLGVLAMAQNINNKQLIFEMELKASVEDVYNTWTTNEGIQTFFAPGCDIEMKLFGNFHIYFFPENPPGSRGAEDEILIAHEENKMLSFTWGFPPSLMKLRENQKTIVLIRFKEIDDHTTKLTFIQSGWGDGEEWQKGFEYFDVAWGKVVLARLKYRFEHGPVDWKNPPDFNEYEVKRTTQPSALE